MAETAIGWTHRRHPQTGCLYRGYTFNPWIGCTKVPGRRACGNCYAERLDAKRFSKTLGGATPQAPISHWGKGAPRSRTTADYWKQPLKWDREARNAGIALAVFCGSLCDWADEEVPDTWRDDLLEVIHATPNLDWLMLTKRTANARRYLTSSAWWNNATPQNVWMGATMEDQQAFDSSIEDLLAIPAKVHFASMEPLFSAIDCGDYLRNPLPFEACACCAGDEHSTRLDWVIVGGESYDGTRAEKQQKARPMHPDDAYDIALQCWANGVPFYFKQWGEYAPAYELQDAQAAAMVAMDKVPGKDLGRGDKGRRWSWFVGKDIAGRHFEGKLWDEMPAVRLVT